MKRYHYESNAKDTGRVVDGVYKFSVKSLPGFNIFDRKRGSAHEQRVAFCYDRDDAEMIVDALNTRALLVDSVDR